MKKKFDWFLATIILVVLLATAVGAWFICNQIVIEVAHHPIPPNATWFYCGWWTAIIPLAIRIECWYDPI